jgi:hypothetical protein
MLKPKKGGCVIELRWFGATVLILTMAGEAAAQTPTPSPNELVTPAVAPPQTATPGDGESAAGLKSRDRIVCRSVRYTGSRLPERQCKTKRELQAQQEAAAKSADIIKQRTSKFFRC